MSHHSSDGWQQRGHVETTTTTPTCSRRLSKSSNKKDAITARLRFTILPLNPSPAPTLPSPAPSLPTPPLPSIFVTAWHAIQNLWNVSWNTSERHQCEIRESSTYSIKGKLSRLSNSCDLLRMRKLIKQAKAEFPFPLQGTKLWSVQCSHQNIWCFDLQLSNYPQPFFLGIDFFMLEFHFKYPGNPQDGPQG